MPNIQSTHIYRKDLTVLARYVREGGNHEAMRPPAEFYGEVVAEDYAEVFRPVILGFESVGGIGFRSDLRFIHGSCEHPACSVLRFLLLTAP